VEQPAISTVQTSDTSGWNIVELVVVGAVWYTATVLLLVLSIFALYSIPSLGFDAHHYRTFQTCAKLPQRAPSWRSAFSVNSPVSLSTMAMIGCLAWSHLSRARDYRNKAGVIQVMPQ